MPCDRICSGAFVIEIGWRPQIQILGFEADIELSANLTNAAFINEFCPIASEKVSTQGRAHGLARYPKLYGRRALRRLGCRRSELATTLANRAIPGDLGAVCFDPSHLSVPKATKPRGIVLDDTNSFGRFRNPKLEVGDLPCELVHVLGRKSFQLLRD